MPWRLRLREKPATFGDGSDIAVGDCWYEDWLTASGAPESYRRSILSRQYLETWDGKRAPLMIAVPATDYRYRLISPDCAYSRQPNPALEGWTVTGDPPNLTASPSINAEGDYHGWLRNGVLSEDVEGRQYPGIPRTA